MRKREETITKYVADDGMEFYSERDCLEHEDRCKAEDAEKRMRELPHFDAVPPFVYVDDEWRWFYVKDQADVDDVATALFNLDSVARDFRPDHFPCWVAAISCDWDSGCGRMIEYDECIAAYEEFKRQLTANCERAEGDA